MRSNRSNTSHPQFARAEEFDPYHEGQHDEEMYDDDPPRRSWGRRLTALTLICCSSVYAYRTYIVEPGSTQTRPVITAEETPSNVSPAIRDPESRKMIQDRVGTLGSGERMVSREEQPVDARGTGSTPGNAWPWPPTPSQPPPQGAASATDTASSGPKRIATVEIRPDGTEASGRRVTSPPPGTSTPVTPSQAKPVQRTARGAPLSLDPRALTSDDAAAPPTQRALTSPAPQMAATPARAAAVNDAVEGYVVQVSSLRSEADARASFRSLQEKFPNLLGDRTAIVRRADLGAKGIYYRAMTGPFATAGEADQLCSSLKAAGGQCIIQRN